MVIFIVEVSAISKEKKITLLGVMNHGIENIIIVGVALTNCLVEAVVEVVRALVMESLEGVVKAA